MCSDPCTGVISCLFLYRHLLEFSGFTVVWLRRVSLACSNCCSGVLAFGVVARTKSVVLQLVVVWLLFMRLSL